MSSRKNMRKKRRKRRRKLWLIPLIIVAALVVGLYTAAYYYVGGKSRDTILNGISIGGMDVGGLTEAQAEEILDTYIADLGKKKIKLTADDVTIKTTAAELGISCANPEIVKEAMDYGNSGSLIERVKAKHDLEENTINYDINVKLDKSLIISLLESHEEELTREAVDWELTREDGEFVLLGGTQGWSVDEEASAEVINNFFAEGWVDKASIPLTLLTVEPNGSYEQLSAVKDVLGEFTTYYGDSASGRKTNVANACSLINGSLIFPGESFSVGDTISPYTADNGYALATAYENGTTVDAMGGGVCQVSTTLYNAVIRAELEVLERNNHSMIVSYVKPSMDAAIADGSKDFKFKNNLDYPIWIEGSTNGAYITFTIYGAEYRDENRTVEFVSETTGTTQPTTQFKATSNAIGYISKVQSSHTGYSARLWKIVTVNGEVVSKDVFNTSNYRMSPNIYEVGVSSPSEEATAAMKQALASGDLGTVKAAIEQWKNAGNEPEEPEETEETEETTENEENTESEETQQEETTGSEETAAETEQAAEE